MAEQDKSKELNNILNSLGDEILSSSDDEILELYRLSDLDPDKGFERVKSVISESINVYRRKALKEARLNQESQFKKMQKALSKIPEAIQEQRALLEQILERPDLPEALTLSFREGKEIPDEDLKSTLEDLEALGLLDDAEEQ